MKAAHGLTAALLIAATSTAAASAALDARIRYWEPICSNHEKSKLYAECWKGPGETHRAYEYEDPEHARMVKKGQEVIEQRQRTDYYLHRNRNR